jgi:hypothetical protein
MKRGYANRLPHTLTVLYKQKSTKGYSKSFVVKKAGRIEGFSIFQESGRNRGREGAMEHHPPGCRGGAPRHPMPGRDCQDIGMR